MAVGLPRLLRSERTPPSARETQGPSVSAGAHFSYRIRSQLPGLIKALLCQGPSCTGSVAANVGGASVCIVKGNSPSGRPR